MAADFWTPLTEAHFTDKRYSVAFDLLRTDFRSLFCDIRKELLRILLIEVLKAEIAEMPEDVPPKGEHFEGVILSRQNQLFEHLYVPLDGLVYVFSENEFAKFPGVGDSVLLKDLRKNARFKMILGRGQPSGVLEYEIATEATPRPTTHENVAQRGFRLLSVMAKPKSHILKINALSVKKLNVKLLADAWENYYASDCDTKRDLFVHIRDSNRDPIMHKGKPYGFMVDDYIRNRIREILLLRTNTLINHDTLMSFNQEEAVVAWILYEHCLWKPSVSINMSSNKSQMEVVVTKEELSWLLNRKYKKVSEIVDRIRVGDECAYEPGLIKYDNHGSEPTYTFSCKDVKRFYDERVTHAKEKTFKRKD